MHFVLQILHVISINAAAFICPPGKLVQIVAVNAKKPNHFFHIGKIHADLISVDCHFPEVRAFIAHTDLTHPLFDLFCLFLRCKEMVLNHLAVLLLCHISRAPGPDRAHLSGSGPDQARNFEYVPHVPGFSP